MHLGSFKLIKKILAFFILIFSSQVYSLETKLGLGFFFANSLNCQNSKAIHFAYPDIEGGLIFDNITIGFEESYNLNVQGYNFFKIKEGSQVGAFISYQADNGIIAEIEINKSKRHDIFNPKKELNDITMSISSLFQEYAKFAYIDHSVVSTLFNLSYVFESNYRIRPFVGLGLGIAKINISGKNHLQISPSFSLNLEDEDSLNLTYDYYALSSFDSQIENNENNYEGIGNIKLGLFFGLNENLSLSLAYKFTSLFKNKSFENMPTIITDNKEGTKYISGGLLPSIGLPGDRAIQVSFYPKQVGTLNVQDYYYSDQSIEISFRHNF